MPAGATSSPIGRKELQRLYYFALKRTGDRHDAEELAQEIAVQAIASLRSGCAPGDRERWLWGVARHQYARWVKRRKHARVRTRSLAASEHRRILVAYYLKRRRLADIATAVGLPVGTVKRKLFEARKALREGMQMARTNGQRSYAPEEVRFYKNGDDGRDGSPWTLLKRLIPKNILLEAYTNPCTLEELSLALGIAAPFMEEEVRLLHDGTLLAQLDDGRYETDFVILDKTTQLDLFDQVAQAGAMLTPLLLERLDAAEGRIRDIGFRRNDLPSETLNWWLVLRAVDHIGERVHAAKDAHDGCTARPHGGAWDMVGYEACTLPFDPFVGLNGNIGGKLSTAKFWAYKIPLADLFERAGELGPHSVVALVADVFRSDRTLGSLSEPERLTIQQLADRGFLQIESERIEPTFPVFAELQKGELTRLDAILDEVAAGDVEAVVGTSYDAVAARIQRDVPARLVRQVQFASGMQLSHLRMMVLRQALAAGRIRVPEDIKKSTIAMHMEI